MTSRRDRLDELTEALMTASRELVGISVRSIAAAPVPVTVQQHRVLVLLATRGQMTVGDIADLVGVNQSNASRLCDRLQKLALVDRQRATEDGRVVQVSLTDGGRRVVDAVTDVRRRQVADVVEVMSVQDVQSAVSALMAFNEAAMEHVDRHPVAAST